MHNPALSFCWYLESFVVTIIHRFNKGRVLQKFVILSLDPLGIIYGGNNVETARSDLKWSQIAKLADFQGCLELCTNGDPPPSPPHKIFSFKKWGQWQVHSYTFDGASWITSGPSIGPYCPHILKRIAVFLWATSRARVDLQIHVRYLYCNFSCRIVIIDLQMSSYYIMIII